jgi:adenosylcobinamide-GDP ribazoletransferase
MISGLITAIRTLTIIPVPGKDSRNLASSLPWFPVVGLLIGGILYACAVAPGLVGAEVWPQAIAALLLVFGVLLTRAIHLDGLADWADGFGGRGDKEKILAIMKDPHVGSFGVIALVAVLLLQWVALVRIVENGLEPVIVAACLLSRTMQVELAASHPYARTGEGTAAPFVNGSAWWHRLVAHVIGIAMVIALIGPLKGVALFAGGLIITVGFGWWCRKRVGGITGDCIGAGSVIVETAVLFAGVW